MKILFVCKYNRFRSKVAEGYLKSKVVDGNFSVASAGLIPSINGMEKRELKVVNKFGIEIHGKPQGLNTRKIFASDLIVIVADNIPKRLFRFHNHKLRVLKWRIKDFNPGESEEEIEEIVKQIIKKVDRLVETELK